MKISIIFLLGGLGLSAWAQAPAASGAGSRLRDMIEEGRPVKIACFGDSVTGVYYHTGTRRAWCDLLGLALRRIYPQARLEMINAGVSGNDTGDGLKRMERDVLRHSPQLAIIMFGLNDARSQSPATYRKNLGTMVRRVRDAGAEAMLMTPNAVGPDDPLRPPRIVAEYAQIMRDVGSDLAVPVVDAYATFAVIQGADPATWRGLMSDTIHPNMRGHRIFAEETAQAISGRFVSLAELPALKPGLPFVLARLRAHQPVRVLAMAPCDTLIAPALRARFPDAVVEVTAWQPDPDSITAIEAQARERGWEKFRHDKEAVRPDLVLVAVPSTARAATDEQFRHSYYWTLNWSLSSGMKPGPEWDCLVVLPSVTGEKWDAGTQAAEERALDIVRGQDIPWVARDPADRRTAVDLLSAALGPLL